MKKRYSILDGNPMNRRFSTLDGTPLNPQDPEGVPSHRCLILDQSFEALKSARSSTETMKRVQHDMERAVNTEGEKNERYKQSASEFASFSEEIENTAHRMESVTRISKDNENAGQTMVSQDEGNIANHRIFKDNENAGQTVARQDEADGGNHRISKDTENAGQTVVRRDKGNIANHRISKENENAVQTVVGQDEGQTENHQNAAEDT